MTVEFPHSMVLFLRSTKKTPDTMTIEMKTPGGTVRFGVPVMKAQRYSLEEIFQKKLLFLLPFYIFSYESRLKEYNENEEKLEALKEEYKEIAKRLEQLRKGVRKPGEELSTGKGRSVFDYGWSDFRV